MTKERVDKSMYWLRPDFATALGVSLSKLRAIENKPGFPEFKIVTNPETGTQYKVFNRREAEAFVSQYLDDKATFCTRMAIDFVVTAARPLDRNVRVLWPKERAPLKIKTRCPICGAGLLLDAGEATELEDATGEWIATEINLDCESEPDIDSDEWDEWHCWHYRMPYVDWLPLEQRILSAVRRKYHFAP